MGCKPAPAAALRPPALPDALQVKHHPILSGIEDQRAGADSRKHDDDRYNGEAAIHELAGLVVVVAVGGGPGSIVVVVVTGVLLANA